MLRSLAPLLLMALLAVLLAGALVAATRGEFDDGLADMNHAAHISRDLVCVDCHTGVETHARAGIPSIKICADCHDDPEDAIGRTKNGKLILEHVQKGEELTFPGLYKLPEHVVFSHYRHVKLGNVECARCHGDMGATTTLPERPIEGTLTMEGCMTCHEAAGAANDCFDCHK